MAVNKNAGGRSQQQNDFVMPMSPTSVSATNVGTGRPFNDGSAIVTFSLPSESYAASSYTVTSSPGGYTATGSSSPITISGLQSDTSYTFIVTASNEFGTSDNSAASSAITITTVPSAPTGVSASSPNADQDQISWSASSSGGSAITNYHWESNDGKSGDTGTGLSTTLGQEAGTSQSYRVYATNANGNSEWSSYSNAVTTTFSFTPFSFTPFTFTPFSFTPFAFTPFAFTPFAFTPFAFTPFAFTPFAFTPFSFTPFTVFGFTPFAVFGFSPIVFSVFGFSPVSFVVFGFSPTKFKVFGFSPVYVARPAQDTLDNLIEDENSDEE